MSRALLLFLTGITYFLVLGPIVIVVVTAFSPTEFFVFPPPGLSIRWFEAFFANDSLRGAFGLSLELAFVSAAAATVLGTMAAVFVARRRGWIPGLLQVLFLAPLI